MRPPDTPGAALSLSKSAVSPAKLCGTSSSSGPSAGSTHDTLEDAAGSDGDDYERTSRLQTSEPDGHRGECRYALAPGEAGWLRLHHNAALSRRRCLCVSARANLRYDPR